MGIVNFYLGQGRKRGSLAFLNWGGNLGRILHGQNFASQTDGLKSLGKRGGKKDGGVK